MTDGRVLIIAGATASGKSNLALHLARSLNGVIINGDSVQAIAHADIGSAKPVASERAQVEHLLLDCRQPSERWDAGSCSREVSLAIAETRNRGKLPIVVMPSGLYLTALVHGLASLPQADPQVRANLELRPTIQLWEELSKQDPRSAQRIHRNDRKRIVRAMETLHLTSIPLGEHHHDHNLRTIQHPALMAVLVWNRDELALRISERVSGMIKAGLLDECRMLQARYGSTAPIFETIGYREGLACLEGRLPIEGLHPAITLATQQFAKRQLTFWRNEPRKRGWTTMPELQTEETVIRGGSVSPDRLKREGKGIRVYRWDRRRLLAELRERIARVREVPEVLFLDGAAIVAGSSPDI